MWESGLRMHSKCATSAHYDHCAYLPALAIAFALALAALTLASHRFSSRFIASHRLLATQHHTATPQSHFFGEFHTITHKVQVCE